MCRGSFQKWCACYTTDLVVKKMVYLYLTHYAPMNPELAILAINTLRKDCGDADPMVRGLAMRSLSSLRLQSVLEYILDPLRACLKDSSPYVRRAAVIGVAKIHHLDRATVEESDLVDRLYNMVRDADPAVAIDCLNVLNEIMADEGGLAVNQQIMTYLLNRIGDFSEWGQIAVLGFLPKYSPASQEEIFAIMNILDGCLRTSNSGVALATTRCFPVPRSVSTRESGGRPTCA